MVPPQKLNGTNAGQGRKLVFASDEEMVEYYREALYEAAVFCMTKGFTEEQIYDMDVYGFGEIYKYLKRLDAREQIRMIGNMSLAFGGTEKDMKAARKILQAWLPKEEQGGGKKKQDGAALAKLLNSGF